MAIATAQPQPDLRVVRKQELTVHDYRNLRNIFECETDSEIPPDIIAACLKRQRIYHRTRTGILPLPELKIALELCGVQMIGKRIRQIMPRPLDLPDTPELDGHIDVGADSMTPDREAGETAASTYVQEKTNSPPPPKEANPWKAVEKGSLVLCETDKGVRPGKFAGLGAGGHPMVQLAGDDEPKLMTGTVRLQDVPKEE